MRAPSVIIYNITDCTRWTAITMTALRDKTLPDATVTCTSDVCSWTVGGGQVAASLTLSNYGTTSVRARFSIANWNLIGASTVEQYFTVTGDMPGSLVRAGDTYTGGTSTVRVSKSDGTTSCGAGGTTANECSAHALNGVSGFYVQHTTAQYSTGARMVADLEIALRADVDCVISDFSSANGPCPVTCGDGTRTWTATITTPPVYHGAACPPLTQQRSCSTGVPCPVATVASSTAAAAAVANRAPSSTGSFASSSTAGGAGAAASSSSAGTSSSSTGSSDRSTSSTSAPAPPTASSTGPGSVSATASSTGAVLFHSRAQPDRYRLHHLRRHRLRP